MHLKVLAAQVVFDPGSVELWGDVGLEIESVVFGTDSEDVSIEAGHDVTVVCQDVVASAFAACS